MFHAIAGDVAGLSSRRDGRRRQRAPYVRVPTGAPRELDFVGLPLSCRGNKNSQGDESSHRESAYLPRRWGSASSTSVGGSAARARRRRRPLEGRHRASDGAGRPRGDEELHVGFLGRLRWRVASVANLGDAARPDAPISLSDGRLGRLGRPLGVDGASPRRRGAFNFASRCVWLFDSHARPRAAARKYGLRGRE